MTNHDSITHNQNLTDAAGNFPEAAADLAPALAVMSEPAAPPVELWRAALNEAEGQPAVRQRLFSRVWVRSGAAIAAAVVLASGGAILYSKTNRVGATVSASVPELAKVGRVQGLNLSADAGYHRQIYSDSAEEPGTDGREFSYGMMPSVAEKRVLWSQRSQPTSIADASHDRSIVRRASLGIECDDVRSAFAKALAMPTEALAEFSESASITGDGDSARADITLRVRADRLSTVMNQLRSLGKVTSENLNSVDVTDRLTDLDATIRNEKKVELELLDLADRRKDAPLKEILELREHLSEIRARIEKLEGQKLSATKQVALSTIVLTIQHEAKETPPEPAKSDFGDKMSLAWKSGTSGLGDSLAWCVESGIAHLPMWVAIGAFGLATWVGVRRAIRWSGQEPKPRLG